MNNPIGAFEEIRDNFILYLKTAFRTQFPGLELEREAMLRRPGVLNQEPWIEPLPRYLTAEHLGGLETNDLPGMSRSVLDRFKDLALCGLVGDHPLYTHQVTMLQKAIAGQNSVVTAGTGSGKTEAFLLPLFASLAAESQNWDAPNSTPNHIDDWWSNNDWQSSCKNATNRLTRSFRVSQRGHENRPAAVRALILYPMNALVEDQLTRLRRALDSTQARQWCADFMNGNRIYFGRYTGNTPVPGHEHKRSGYPDRRRIEKLAMELTSLDRGVMATADYAEQMEAEANTEEEGNVARDLVYFFPRLEGAEMRSRWDMQETPPDILITNYSMLSIMLMREVDASMFEQTRQWLNQPGSLFHLIIDELHLYRGTSGTEVAYLLRLLLHRLGLTPTDPRLRILASSASLDPENNDSLTFLEDFFGCSWTQDQIIPGVEQPVSEEISQTLNKTYFVMFGEAYESNNDAALAEACDGIVRSLDPGITDDDPQVRMCAALESQQDRIASQMLDACFDGTRTRAVSLSTFASRMFGNDGDDETTVEALRGLLIARAMCASRRVANSLPRFRLHWFFRNIEGLWACTQPGCQCDAQHLDGTRPVGRLYPQNQILCGNQDQQHRVLELLYCEQCGTVFFGGSPLYSPEGDGLEILSTDPDIEGLPDKQAARFVDRRTYREFRIFWPQGQRNLNSDARSWRQPKVARESSERARWARKNLDSISGRVTDAAAGATVPDGFSIPGYLYVIPGIDTPDDEQSFSALPACCPNCAADYSWRVYRTSPVRGFRTGFSRVSQLLAKELFYHLPGGDTRKLVVFSDSREDAASISNGIERTHYRDLVREAMYDELYRVVFDEGMLLADLERYREPRNDEVIVFARKNPEIEVRLNRYLDFERRPISEDLHISQREVLEQERQRAVESLRIIRQRFASRLVALRSLYESSSDGETISHPGFLINRLKQLGINPAGNDVMYQMFNYEGAGKVASDE
ncbi:MAG: DEAD/DEAH box helicase, partial [Nitrosomonadaceae bacterium]